MYYRRSVMMNGKHYDNSFRDGIKQKQCPEKAIVNNHII